MENIQAGDTVRHTAFPHLNGGMALNVLEVMEGQALCTFFDEEHTHRQRWFLLSDLTLADKGDGGFFEWY